MPDPKRATPEERQAMKEAFKAVLRPEWTSIDVGEVMTSFGAAMMKAVGTSEASYLDFTKRVWGAQHARDTSGEN